MTLDSLHLLFFKNYDEANLAFSPGINCFIGDNGSGKTNLLDAIHYLALTKSAFTTTDAQSIKQDGDFFVVKGRFSSPPPALPLSETIQVSLRQGQKKTLTHDKQPYERMADHIGRYPAVLISPYDTDLIRQGSEERRKYFDSLQSQLDHDFLDLLITYNALLRQRNATLKQGADRHGFDHEYLLALDEQLVPVGQQVSERRTAFLTDFLPVFQRHYQHLAEEQEQVSLAYKSQLTNQDFGALLRANERRDQLLQRTHAGPHRDDFVFLMEGRSVKNYASQGQQKSFAIALKLAQFETLAASRGQKPLLLLDDIFDRLDDKRIARLLELVANDTFGQVFLTDTNLARTDRALERVSTAIQRFRVQAGTVTPVV